MAEFLNHWENLQVNMLPSKRKIKPSQSTVLNPEDNQFSEGFELSPDDFLTEFEFELRLRYPDAFTHDGQQQLDATSIDKDAASSLQGNFK